MSYLGEGTMDRRMYLWDWIDEHYPSAFETPGYPMLQSETLRAEAVAALFIHLGLTPHQREQLRLAEAVGRWLDDPDRFSPHVDEIALELATGFDWDVIAHLTQDERGILLDRLDAMRDPFDANTEDVTIDGFGGPPILVSASRRRMAYRRGPPNRRCRLDGALSHRRRRALVSA